MPRTKRRVPKGTAEPPNELEPLLLEDLEAVALAVRLLVKEPLPLKRQLELAKVVKAHWESIVGVLKAKAQERTT